MVNEKISWLAIAWAHYFQQKNYNSITLSTGMSWNKEDMSIWQWMKIDILLCKY